MRSLRVLTLRAIARLQEADVIFYDRLVDPGVLELARRDAERVFVGKVVGAHAWPQEQIDAAVVTEARKGRRVVRLKSGDPGIFGRLDEELAAARAAGIAPEIVPGVTAACAAAASLGRALTSRGATDALVSTTARRRGDGAPIPTFDLRRPWTHFPLPQREAAVAPHGRLPQWRWAGLAECLLPAWGEDEFAPAANDRIPPIPWKKIRSPAQNIDG